MKTTLISTSLPLFTLNHERTKGRHVSAIIHDLCLRRGIYKPQDEDNVDTTRMRLGQAWEYALIEQLKLEHPGEYLEIPELELDDIFGHLDLYHVSHLVDEFKCTWMSLRHDIDSPKIWKYIVQLKAYCRMIKTQNGSLRIVYPMGDYKTFSVGYRHWEFEFTKAELNENWRMLRSHADLMEKEGHQWQS